MSKKKVYTAYTERSFKPKEQYSQFFQSCNWYTYNLFQFEVEVDYVGRWTGYISFVILGFGFTIHRQKISKEMQEFADKMNSD